MAALYQLVNHLSWHFDAFSVTDGHDSTSNHICGGSSERKVSSDVVEGLHFWQSTIVANHDYGDVGFLRHCRQGTHTTSITSRHPIDLVHDEHEFSLCSVDFLAVSCKIAKNRGSVKDSLQTTLDELFASRVAGIALNHVESFQPSNQVSSSRFPDTRWTMEHCSSIDPFPVSSSFLEIPFCVVVPHPQPSLQSFNQGFVSTYCID